jgi:hypothetical protein
MVIATLWACTSGAELSWTDSTVETPCDSLFAVGCSRASLQALGGSKVGELMIYSFGVLIIAADPQAEVMDMTIVFEKADRSKDTFNRKDLPIKEEHGIKHVSQAFSTLDVPVTSVLSIDTVEKTRDGKKRTTHRFR